MAKLQGKTAIITGGSGGIGLATAKLFLDEGANVMLVDLREEDLERARRDLDRARTGWLAADVSDEEQTRRYVEATLERFGAIDVLFANAGIEGTLAPIADVAMADFDRLLAVNVRGVFLGVRAVMPRMLERGGSIMVTSSVAGLVGFGGLSPYVISKHALVGLVRTAALEGATANIRVNSIHPGPIANRMMDSLEQQMSPEAQVEARRNLEQMVPMGRYGTNEEIARLALFLASDDSAYCTGQTFVADGGFVAR
jgi:NAD(P)-dependent dehydrogenase (short-subunit alcohol dehydrogenase family)